MMGRLQVICTTDQIKEAKHNVQKYMRKHKSDEDFIENISDDFVMGFMISQRMAWDDYDNGTQRENDDFGKWIPCSERLPENDKKVLCYVDSSMRVGDDIVTGSQHDGLWFMQSGVGMQSFSKACTVTAWMPLSGPYREEE